MKAKSFYFAALIFTLYGCKMSENQPLDLPVVHIDQLPAEPLTVNLADLVENVDIIMLETSPDALIRYPFPTFTKDFIFVGTQTNVPDPAKMFQFDYSGHFIREIGKAGRGPGEHNGYMPGEVHYFEGENKMIATWDAGSDKPQVFDTKGNYIGDLDVPSSYVAKMQRLSDSVWFVTGPVAGPARRASDSVLVTFFSSNGKLLSTIPRKNFPPDDKKYTYYGGTTSYHYNNQWRLFREDNDTLFTIEDQHLVPTAIMVTGDKRIPFNESAEPESLVGKYKLEFLGETDKYWFARKFVISKLDVNYNEKYGWGGMTTQDYHYVIIDKSTLKAVSFRLEDNLFHLMPSESIKYIINWEGDHLYFAFPAFDLMEALKSVDRTTLTPAIQEKIKVLDALKESDNPVIFYMTLKDKLPV